MIFKVVPGPINYLPKIEGLFALDPKRLCMIDEFYESLKIDSNSSS